ncbi:MAG: hypothetical protein Fur0037_01100 [Planctomycetota bacterium]
MASAKSFDLYKGIILGCLVLMPVSGFWIRHLYGRIDACERAVAAATRPGGTLETIGLLQRKMDTVKSNRSVLEQLKDPGLYFDKQIRSSDRSGTISSDDFQIPGTRDVVGGSGKQRFVDKEQQIIFGKRGSGRNDRSFNRDFIWALIYNCESGAGSGSSIWKLRKLEIVNATDEKTLTSKRTPPPELEDRWTIRDLKFARRQPFQGK